MIRVAAVAVVFWVALVGPAAPLSPDELIVVAAARDPDSLELARYYMQARSIPEGHLFSTGMPEGEQISRVDYDRMIAGPLRAWLEKENLDQVRAVVLIRGVPLRVQPPKQTREQRRLVFAIESLRREQLDRAHEMLAAMGHPVPPPDGEPEDFNAQLAQLQGRLLAVFGQQAQELGEEPEARRQWLENWAAAFGFAPPERAGLAGAPTPDVDDAGRAAASRRISQLIVRPLDMQAYNELVDLIERSRGTIGLLQSTGMLLELLRPGASSTASVDSELCTLFWPEYPTHGRVMNPLALDPVPENAPRTLMVCRLDGPDAATVRRMIDDGISAEREGLRGRVYIDARSDGRGQTPTARFDADLVNLANMVEQHTDLEVVLETTGALFQPGQCPEAALYCGWYSLAKYIPAFEFVPGAVAVHVASSEAVWLRREQSTLWCPALLREGAAATLGPVAEPYLQAFPPPSAFFSRLLTGRQTLIECFFSTLPSLSWMMTLIGDPLYNPFAARPALDPAHVPAGARMLRYAPPGVQEP